jgi:hypothetical protein
MEDESELAPACPDRESRHGKHSLKLKSLWAAVVLADAWGVVDEEDAIEMFSQSAWYKEAYLLAKRLTAEEIDQLRTGGTLKLVVEPATTSTPQTVTQP